MNPELKNGTGFSTAPTGKDGVGGHRGVIAQPTNIRPLIALGSFIDSLFVCFYSLAEMCFRSN